MNPQELLQKLKARYNIVLTDRQIRKYAVNRAVTPPAEGKAKVKPKEKGPGRLVEYRPHTEKEFFASREVVHASSTPLDLEWVVVARVWGRRILAGHWEQQEADDFLQNHIVEFGFGMRWLAEYIRAADAALRHCGVRAEYDEGAKRFRVYRKWEASATVQKPTPHGTTLNPEIDSISYEALIEHCRLSPNAVGCGSVGEGWEEVDTVM